MRFDLCMRTEREMEVSGGEKIVRLSRRDLLLWLVNWSPW